MFAAASGARLAHRHDKPAVRKQASSSQIEGLQIHYKSFQLKQQQRLEGPNLAGRPPREYSYIDLNSRISKLDFEGDGVPNKLEVTETIQNGRNQGKAAWQDRELGPDFERHDSLEVTSDGASTHRSKQKEAHRRWVKRNRIHDSSLGDCSSDEDDIYGPYGVQNAAANALLYIGLGTMAVGMIIAFVGTGEKGFKTMELRLIGPSLIGFGVLIVILRIMLCVCPSKCLRHKHKHKHKNSTNKLNSEEVVQTLVKTEKPTVIVPSTSGEQKQNISATVSFLESERAIELKPIFLPPIKPPRIPSDVSVTSLSNGSLTPVESESQSIGNVKKVSKFEKTRLPKNGRTGELLLSPTTLEEINE